MMNIQTIWIILLGAQAFAVCGNDDLKKCRDKFCIDHVNANSYCKDWKATKPWVCHGSDDVHCSDVDCGTSPPPTPTAPPQAPTSQPPTQPAPTSKPSLLECGDRVCKDWDNSVCYTVCQDVFTSEQCDLHTGQPTPLPVPSPSSQNDWYAFIYNDPKSKTDFFDEVTTLGYKGVFVYGGDVEFYCAGQPKAPAGGGASPTGTPCKFSNPGANAFVYYSDFARQTAREYKEAGLDVWITFDGRIDQFVPDFSLLSNDEIEEFASAVATHICSDAHVTGMSWDVEPFHNNQVPFFEALDRKLTLCHKRWNIFAFGEHFSEEMWTTGLGQSGFLMDSTYDLSPGRPCDCVEPSVYKTRLRAHLSSVLNLAAKYGKEVFPLVSGGGSTQIYETITTEECLFGDGTVHIRNCPHTMLSYAQVIREVIEEMGGIRKNFNGVGVYPYTITDNGGFSPGIPSKGVVQYLFQTTV